ncbi:amino acid adenylation domain-containing protein [Streptomyces sp. NPDC046805]|uniref:amino acid adenylation domain-containing protein n=1 Tax=Streptomyces sp. NPDC046805 TaxID=3155134 RepID=UPI0033E03196
MTSAAHDREKSPREESIASIWAKILDVEQIGSDDDFFELGGTSLLAMRVVARLKKAFDVKVPLRTIFEAPTVSGLDAAIRNLESNAPIVARPKGAPRTLSLGQRRMWFLDQLGESRLDYIVPVGLRLRGKLDAAALTDAVNALVERHETLRTTFPAEQGEPTVRVHPAAEGCVPLIDLSGLPRAEAEERADRLASDQLATPFDLANGPLLRVQLVRLAAEEHVLQLAVHHIVTDGWSMTVLIRELGMLLDGVPEKLPDLPITYSDYAAWQHENQPEEDLGYWREALDGAPPRLELATRPHQTDEPGNGAGLHRVELPPALTSTLADLGGRVGATPFMVLLAGFTLLLARLSGQDDLVVGTPVACRDRLECEGVVGLFLDTLALRMDASGELTFDELLERVKRTTVDAYTHRDVPFDRIVAELKPERDLDRNPFFDVLFNFTDSLELPDTFGAGLDVQLVDTPPQESKFWLTVYGQERDGRFVLDLVYREDVFDASQVAIMADQFASLLEQIAADSGRALSAYSLMTPAQLDVLPDPAAELAVPGPVPVGSRFLEVAAGHPDLPAVSCGEREWSYAELAEAALGVAGRIQAAGVGDDEVVAIHGERGYGVIAALLGALVSGRPLLLVDAALPVGRRLLMLREAQAVHLIAVGRPAPPEMAATVRQVTELDPDKGLGGEPGMVGGQRGPAYVFFTSGTTGTPKGVLGSHEGLAHFLDWQRGVCEAGPGDRAAHLTSLSFDVVLRDILLPLTSGATLCVPPREYTPAGLFAWMRGERISLIHTVPAVTAMWLSDEHADHRLDSLRCTFFAGEPLTRPLVTGWRDEVNEQARIVNLYGPTETTLAKFWHEADPRAAHEVEPVGRPLPDTQGIVLSPTGERCGVGEPGEVVIRTPMRSLGYLNQATPFVTNPFTEEDLLYPTGDRGRYRADGTLELLGRLDDQLKIRGVRVEPGEIVAQLRRHDKVRDACVIGLGDRLVCYVVPAAEDPATGELRALLRRSLPDYLVPGTFMCLRELPVTANGKLDRRALPEPPAGGDTDDYAAPQSAAEQQIAGIWAEALQVARVGRHDNFFDLGGHSLLAMRAATRLRDTFGVELPLRAFFEAPTVADLSERLSAEMMRLVQERFTATDLPAQQPVTQRVHDGPEAVAHDGPLPLSSAQRRLWFLDQLEPDSPEYVIAFALGLSGELDRAALHGALDDLVRRHTILRTAFSAADGTPVQQIMAPMAADVREMDLSDRPQDCDETLRAFAGEPFDLSRPPLLRALLIRRSRAEWVLGLAVHHIAADGWSVDLLIGDLGAHYAARVDEGHARPAPLGLQYADVAVWERNRGTDELLDKQLGYWKERLSGARPLELPTDRPRPPVRSPRGDTHEFVIPAGLVTELKKVARQHDATLYMALLTVFNVLLSRYTGEGDIVVGTTTAGRTRAELEAVVGPFANTLVLRCDTSGDPTFAQLLGRVRDDVLDAFAHPDVPFERLVDELKVPRDLSRTPLFQVLVELQNADGVVVDFPGLAVAQHTVRRNTAKFDLGLWMTEDEDGLLCRIEYSTDLFDGERIRRTAGHLTSLLAGVVADADVRLGSMELLVPEERHELVEAWNDTRADFPEGRCLHELIAEQAARTPANVAIEFEGRQVTYEELNGRANALAHLLRSLGAGPETPVGVCLERSPEMVVSLLAIMKAGSAYLPLDPDYPEERLRFMVEDTAAPLVITTSHRAEQFASHDAVPVLLDQNPEADHPTTDPATLINPDNLAYVIYTSGSTGRPKGVMVSHEGCVNYLWWMHSAFPLSYEDRVLQAAAQGFDISVWEMCWPLLEGAAVVVPKPGGHRDPAYLAGLIETTGVTTVHFVPSLLRVFLQDLEPRRCASLRRVLCSAEPLTPDLQELFFSRLQAELYNIYGATEVSVDSTFWRCDARELPVTVPLGRPMINQTAYVLDRHGNPCPVGVPGEILLGGLSVTRGYLGRPGLTAERFVPDPFSAAPGARMYRTGDTGCRLPSGDLQFIGRTDNQLKLRGYRIEPNEISAALAEHPDVTHAITILRHDDPGHPRLAAYYIAAGADPTPADLREHLKSRLPDYMIPASYLPITHIPLSPNGKVDTSQLPVPPSQPRTSDDYVPPSTPVEKQLTGIWVATLGIEQIGIHDNYFELGGDSILTIQIVAQARKAGLQFSPKDVFQHPTIAELATIAQPLDATQDAPAAEQGSVRGPVPLTPIQREFLALTPPNPHHYNQSVLVEVDDPDLSVLERALAALTGHHDALRLRLHRDDDGIWQQESAAAVPSPPLSVIDLTALPSDRRDEAVEEAAARAQGDLDLAAGRLFSATLFQSGTERPARLLLVIHHLAVDALSWPILLEDLATAYAQLAADRAAHLPPKTTSYQKWARLLEEYGRTAPLQEVGHWSELDGLATVPVPDHPVDELATHNTVGDAACVTADLSAADTKALLHEAPSAYRTRVEDLLLTALALAVGDWQGTGSVTLDLERHGRDHPLDGVDLSRTVGWFTSIHPVRLDLPEGAGNGHATALKAIKEQLRAIPGEGFGYGPTRGPESAREPRTGGIVVNYLGRMDRIHPQVGVFRPRTHSIGAQADPSQPRSHLIEVEAIVADGRLHIEWIYPAPLFEEATIRRVAEDCARHLSDLIAHCVSGARGHTPSDFPLAAIDQPGLDLLLERHDDVVDVYRLAPLQAGMLFHTVYASDSSDYFEQVVFSLDGPLDPEAFERAWQLMVQRHTALRTVIAWEDLREPVQLVKRHAPLDIRWRDWRSRTAAERERLVQELLNEERAAGFELSQSPPHRLTLVRTAEETHQLVWSFHHIVLDGWSVSVVLEEVLNSYDMLCRGARPELGQAAAYRQYIDWLDRQDRDAAEAYWREALAGFTAPTVLSAERQGAGKAGNDAVHLEFSETETRALRSFARRHGLTMSTVLQGAWALLLSRYTGEDDVVFGTTVAGRPGDLPGVESMIGMFINTLPVRVRISADLPAVDWLRDLQSKLIDLRQYEYSSLVDIQGWSEVPRGVPLFQSILVFENYPGVSPEHQPRGLRLSPRGAIERTGYPMTVVVDEDSDRIAAYLRFQQAHFDRDRVERMGGHLRALLTCLAADPLTEVGALDLLAPQERHELIHVWNDTAAAVPDDRCLHELISEQAARTPDSPAIVHGDQRLTYEQLNSRANALAHHLRSLGAGAERPVGVCLERSPEMIISLLAVMKAGSPYLPLDPEYPSERLCFMLADTSAPLVITTSRLAGHFASLDIGRVLVDEHPEAEEPSTDPVALTTPDNLAYVIYTSGSTGRPKGVMVPHRGLVNYLWWCRAGYAHRGDNGAPVFSSFAFDMIVPNLYTPLVMGQPVHVLPQDLDLARLGETLSAIAPLGFIKLTPGHLDLLAGQLTPEQARNLAGVLAVGADALPSGLLDFWLDLDTDMVLLNEYGPTEASVANSTYEIHGAAQDELVPIGKPIPNSTLYVLDERLNPVPVGVEGEIYIGGSSVVRGYLGRPALTAERFVPDPFSATLGARLYRTGDTGRWLPGGDLQFIGRTDDQVKLRGYRIELNEISAVLAEHPDVTHAITTLRHDDPGHPKLAGYYIAAPGAEPTPADLREHLKSRLPEYMIPALYLPITHVPLNPNGKVDTSQLPAPPSHPQTGDDYVPPSTPVEKQLTGIWTATLGIEQIGVHDNYFELGGDSILTIQIVAQARKAGLQFSPKMVFQHPTIAELATVAQPLDAPAERPTGRRTEPAGSQGPGRSAADFPLAGISQQELDRLLSRLSGSE